MSAPAVPLIYAHHRPLPRLGIIERLVAAAIAAACVVVLVTAARLRPDASGLGTHRQLGMTACGLLTSAGVPCPTCGMTTSFAHLARGNVLASLAAQPAGTLFALLAAMAAWAGGYVAATGRPSARLLDALPGVPIFLGLLGVGLIGWAYKIVVILS